MPVRSTLWMFGGNGLVEIGVLPPDFDNDGAVDSGDLAIWTSGFKAGLGASHGQCNANAVDYKDLAF